MQPNARSEMEPDSDVYKTLLESTKAIPWKIDWNTQAFTYIGPQIESLLGWVPSSWVTVQDWVARMHPEDREATVNMCVSQSMAGIDHEADYRALTADGKYVWIRDVVHVVRKGGTVDSLIGFMFDISERKKTEEELLHLQKRLEELSFKDGLTGIANRRMFDSIVEVEWSNARRDRSPLSLIFLDIDYFKQYNDLYGHLQGDDSLKKVAAALGQVATRPRDFIARFGGEEFVMVLPETDAEAARAVAERCRGQVARLGVTHDKAPQGQLSISLGVCTVVPEEGEQTKAFIDATDKLLYRAKHNGRDRAECGTWPTVKLVE
ncbi:MAG TPA: sensor domain-containing diguanylate cyclase [Stellaceae bacterium]|jgi:diguanylate cyclase (GGDEF)-like protein/PAS domain S-box-containing protein|nr:sensor domain-containing diguanylate cyclase [Stellaceae bacterium]